MRTCGNSGVCPFKCSADASGDRQTVGGDGRSEHDALTDVSIWGDVQVPNAFAFIWRRYCWEQQTRFGSAGASRPAARLARSYTQFDSWAQHHLFPPLLSVSFLTLVQVRTQTRRCDSIPRLFKCRGWFWGKSGRVAGPVVVFSFTDHVTSVQQGRLSFGFKPFSKCGNKPRWRLNGELLFDLGLTFGITSYRVLPALAFKCLITDRQLIKRLVTLSHVCHRLCSNTRSPSYGARCLLH